MSKRNPGGSPCVPTGEKHDTVLCIAKSAGVRITKREIDPWQTPANIFAGPPTQERLVVASVLPWPCRSVHSYIGLR